MKTISFLLALCLLSSYSFSQKPKSIHVFVALCDNANQGIVPVPASLGNGQNAAYNLYWGAAFGIKTYFKKSKEWKLLASIKDPKTHILERVVFRHIQTGTMLVADAWDGKYIKKTTEQFLLASSGAEAETVNIEGEASIEVGGCADLLVYIGHDGLMEFSLDLDLKPQNKKQRETIILACISKDYFEADLKSTGAYPLIWTSGLMAPEAYTLKWALDGWVKGESRDAIRLRAAQAYNHYQKCGIRGAKRLLVTGW